MIHTVINRSLNVSLRSSQRFLCGQKYWILRLIRIRIFNVRIMEKTDKKAASSEEAEQNHSKKKMSPFGHLCRFFGWWFGFTGLYSMFAVCPFCGQQGCPVGLASTGTVGAFFALCVQDWKRLITFLKHKLSKQTKDGEKRSSLHLPDV